MVWKLIYLIRISPFTTQKLFNKQIATKSATCSDNSYSYLELHLLCRFSGFHLLGLFLLYGIGVATNFSFACRSRGNVYLNYLFIIVCNRYGRWITASLAAVTCTTSWSVPRAITSWKPYGHAGGEYILHDITILIPGHKYELFSLVCVEGWDHEPIICW